MMNGGTARLETRPGQLVGLRETKALRAGCRRDDLGRGWRKESTTLWSESLVERLEAGEDGGGNDEIRQERSRLEVRN
jgi:hypothetical protein